MTPEVEERKAVRDLALQVIDIGSRKLAKLLEKADPSVRDLLYDGLRAAQARRKEVARELRKAAKDGLAAR